MFVPFRVTGAGSRRSSIESPTPKLPGYHGSVTIVSFCPDGPNATRLWSVYESPASFSERTQTLVSPLTPAVLCVPTVNRAEPASTAVACTVWSALYSFTPEGSILNTLTVANPPK